MSDFIIKNAKYSYTKDGLSIIGNFYQDSWIYNGKEMKVFVEHLEDNLYIDSNKIIYEVL